MNNLLVWEETALIGVKPILQCKRICYESCNIIYDEDIIVNKKSSNIPRCMIQTFGVELVDKILSVSNGLISKFSHDEYLNILNKKMILESNFCYCIEFEMNRIIIEILQSYLVDKTLDHIDNSAKKKILDQIEIDFPRMMLCYNSVKCNTLYEFKTNIEKYNKFSHDTMYTLYYLIVMLCTQASFYYPFSILHNIYTIHDIGIHILPDDDHPYINIIDDQTKLNIVFKKVMKYFDINSQKIITKIHTYMVITIELEEEIDGYIFYGKKYVKSSHGSLYWFKDDNLIIV